MYDVDGNGWIDLLEMTKMVRSIYQVLHQIHWIVVTSSFAAFGPSGRKIVFYSLLWARLNAETSHTHTRTHIGVSVALYMFD